MSELTSHGVPMRSISATAAHAAVAAAVAEAGRLGIRVNAAVFPAVRPSNTRPVRRRQSRLWA